jgi:hypothetical protein
MNSTTFQGGGPNPMNQNRLGGSGNLFINDYAVENFIENGFVIAGK